MTRVTRRPSARRPSSATLTGPSWSVCRLRRRRPTGPQQGRGADLLAEFAAFLEFREQQQREASGADVDVPLFEKLADGTERSATLPMRQARRLLAQWGWVEPEGGAARQFFQSLTGGQQQGGPRPAAGGQRAPRKATG